MVGTNSGSEMSSTEDTWIAPSQDVWHFSHAAYMLQVRDDLIYFKMLVSVH